MPVLVVVVVVDVSSVPDVLASVDVDVLADVDAVLVDDIESDADADPLVSPVSPSSGAGHAVDGRIEVRQAILCMGTTVSTRGHLHRQIDDRRPRGP